MTDLIQIQLITCSAIIVIFAVTLRFKLLTKMLRSFELEPEHYQFLHGIMAICMAYLSFLIVRDLWRVME